MNINVEEEIQIIRTLECDLCGRFDSVMLSSGEVKHRIQQNSLGIGSHILTHGDHLRIVYFDLEANYLGDTISLNVRHQPIQLFEGVVPFFNPKSPPFFKKLKKSLLSLLSSTQFDISIVGPTFAGKTSLTMYLESGIPERYSKRINHAPTMGRSVRRFKFGKTKLTVFDLGGQKNFLTLWGKNLQASNKVIFVIDGSANNYEEISNSLSIVSKEIDENTSVLIIINKMDLLHDGYITQFMSADKILPYFPLNKRNMWIIYSSIYNGFAYNYKDNTEETILAKTILDFLEI